MLNPFTNILGEPYITETSVPTEPGKLEFAIRDHTTVKGMQPAAIQQLKAAANAARDAGLARLVVVAAAGGGHKSHFAGTEWDVIGYKEDGSIWTPAERVAVARGAHRAGATRFGLYSFGAKSLGSGTLHFGYGPAGYADNVTWGYAGQTSGPLSRKYTNPDEIAFRDEVYGKRPSAAPETAIAYGGTELPIKLPADNFAISSVASHPVLRRGSGDESWNRVVQTGLQRSLSLPPSFVDGIFGHQTTAAVKSFQRTRGLHPDGVVGPLTWAALNATAPSGGNFAPNIPTLSISTPSALREPGNIPVRDIAADHLNSYVVKDGADHVVIPALSRDSRPLSEGEAKAAFAASGQHFGKFDSEAAATNYSQDLLSTETAVPAIPSPYDSYLDAKSLLSGLTEDTLKTRVDLRDAVTLAAMRERANIAARRGSATAKRGQTAAFVREFRS